MLTKYKNDIEKYVDRMDIGENDKEISRIVKGKRKKT